MNTRFPEALTGTTTSTASPFLLNGVEAFGANPNVYLPDGFKGDYFIRYADNSTPGFQSGYGVYDADTDTVTSLYIYQSSNGPGVAATFTSAPKHFAFTVSGSELANMAAICLEKPPYESCYTVTTGQSNIARYNPMTDPALVVDNSLVYDYSTDGISSNNTYAFRQINSSDDYGANITALSVGNGTGGIDTPYVGYPRSHSLAVGGLKKMGHMGNAFANFMQKFTGRKQLTLHVWRGGLPLDHEYGWRYWPDSGSCADLIAKKFAHSLTLLAGTPDAGITAPDWVIFCQGEGDIGQTGHSSARYGDVLANFIFAAEDDTRWGWADKNKTKWFLVDIGYIVRHFTTPLAKSFNGHAVAKAIVGDRVKLVNPAGAGIGFDNVHYTGEGAITIGEQIARMAATNDSTSSMDLGLLNLQRESGNYYVDKNLLCIYQWGGVDKALPLAQSKYTHNTARTLLTMSRTSAFGGVYNINKDDIGSWVAGRVLKIGQGTAGATGPTTQGFQYTLTGSGWYDDNHFYFPVSVVDLGAPAPVPDAVGGNGFFHTPIFLTSKCYAATDIPLLSTNLSNTVFVPKTGDENEPRLHTVGLTAIGEYSKTRKFADAVVTARTTTNAAVNLYTSTELTALDIIVFRCRVFGRTGQVIKYDSGYFEGTMYRPASGISTLTLGTITTIVNTDGLTLSVTSTGIYHTFRIAITGKASTIHDWSTHVEAMQLYGTGVA